MKYAVYSEGEQFEYDRKKELEKVFDTKEEAIQHAFKLIKLNYVSVSVEELLENWDHFELKEMMNNAS